MQTESAVVTVAVESLIYAVAAVKRYHGVKHALRIVGDGERTHVRSGSLYGLPFPRSISVDMDNTTSTFAVDTDIAVLLRTLKAYKTGNATITLNSGGGGGASLSIDGNATGCVFSDVEAGKPDTGRYSHVATFNAKTLQAAFKAVGFAQAPDAGRYALCAVALDIKAGVCTAVAADGSRLAMHDVATRGESVDGVFLIDTAAVKAFVGIKGAGDTVTLDTSDGARRLRLGMFDIFATLDGLFPDYKGVMPTGVEDFHTVSLDRKDLLAWCKRILAPVKRWDNTPVIGIIAGESARLGGYSPEADAITRIDDVAGPVVNGGGSIWLNARYFQDVLKAARCKMVTVAYDSVHFPAVVTSGDLTVIVSPCARRDDSDGNGGWDDAMATYAKAYGEAFEPVAAPVDAVVDVAEPEPYTPRESVRANGEPIWLVPRAGSIGEYGRFATIHFTLADAEERADYLRRVDEQQEKTRAASELREVERAAVEAEANDTDGYAESVGGMRAGRIRSTLRRQVRYGDDPVCSMRDLIRRLVADGWTVKEHDFYERKGIDRVLSSPSGTFLWQRIVTKTGLDYAEWLSARAAPDSGGVAVAA